jgi:hypothetical protein
MGDAIAHLPRTDDANRLDFHVPAPLVVARTIKRQVSEAQAFDRAGMRARFEANPELSGLVTGLAQRGRWV